MEVECLKLSLQDTLSIFQTSRIKVHAVILCFNLILKTKNFYFIFYNQTVEMSSPDMRSPENRREEMRSGK